MDVNMINGVQERMWIIYHHNGRKFLDGTFKGGKIDGLQTQWYKNGHRRYEKTF